MRWAPLVSASFLFIWACNWLGALVPWPLIEVEYMPRLYPVSIHCRYLGVFHGICIVFTGSTITTYGWSGDECQDEDRSCRQKSGDHDDTEQGERTLLTNPNGRGIATLI